MKSHYKITGGRIIDVQHRLQVPLILRLSISNAITKPTKRIRKFPGQNGMVLWSEIWTFFVTVGSPWRDPRQRWNSSWEWNANTSREIKMEIIGMLSMTCTDCWRNFPSSLTSPQRAKVHHLHIIAGWFPCWLHLLAILSIEVEGNFYLILVVPPSMKVSLTFLKMRLKN